MHCIVNPHNLGSIFQCIVKSVNLLHYGYFIQCFVTEQGVFVKILNPPMHLLFDIDFHSWR